MPSQKYTNGPELREHASHIACQCKFSERALVQTMANKLVWNDQNRQWTVHATPLGQSPTIVQSDFVILTTRLLDSPKIPKIGRFGDLQGEGFPRLAFHTSRWNYEYTGGSPSNPAMHILQDKTMVFVETGASVIQAIAHLAQWAKKVIVFQRTPSPVDWCRNFPTGRTWRAKSS